MKLSQLIEYQIMKIFIEKVCRKYAPKASPRLLLILVNSSKQPMHASNIFEKRKENYQKKLRKISLIFSFKYSPFL